MTQQIQDKFNELYPASESGTHNVRKSLYNVFKAGWEACLQAQENQRQGRVTAFISRLLKVRKDGVANMMVIW